MIKTILVRKIMTDDDIKDKEGEYFSQKYYSGTTKDIIDGKVQKKFCIKSDCDVYEEIRKNGKWVKGPLLLKFRKNVISKKLTDLALNSYLDASKKKHENRGAAAGVLDRDKLAKYIGKFVDQGKFRTKFYSAHSGKLSKQATSNLSMSNIIGYFDVPDRNLKGKGAPCRLTAFNRDYPDLWKKAIPFLRRCDELFKNLIPKNHKIQYDRAQEVPNFAIPNTAFSTVTVNYSWRTGLHQDAGDLKEGFGNLVVIEDPSNKNEYKGCCLGFPQYGICVDSRTGDFLAMDVHQWHSNTEFIPKSNKIYQVGGKMPSELDVKNGWHFNRMSMVMYLREKMIRCKDKKLWKNKIGANSITNNAKSLMTTKQGGGGNVTQSFKELERDLLQSLPKEYIHYMRKKYGMFL